MQYSNYVFNVMLTELFQILCGEDAVFSEVKDCCDPWYHMLISKALYQDPTVKACDLHYYIQVIDEERLNFFSSQQLNNKQLCFVH